MHHQGEPNVKGAGLCLKNSKPTLQPSHNTLKEHFKFKVDVNNKRVDAAVKKQIIEMF